MAKGGTNLNPGADATLVAAAYRAGMANVPKDLSGTFESLAKSYDATMKSLGESFSNVIEKVGPLAVGMVKNAIKKDSLETKYKGDMINRPANFGDEGVLSEKDWEEQNKMTDPSSDKGTYQEYLDNVGTKMSIGDLFTNIRDEEISLKGKNDPKSKKRIQELKAEKQQIYNELDFLAKADQTNVNLLKSGMVDEIATGQSNMVLSAAIQQYSTSSGKIQEGPYKGYYVDLGDNADKEFTFTLKAPNGDIVTGENIDGTLQTGGKKPISVASSGVADLFVTKYSQENINGINKVYDPLLKQSGTPYGSINVINKIKPFVSNENDLHGAMQTALGSHPTSFSEELKTTSPTSAAYFASLSSVTLKKLGVTDTDGDGFIGDNPNTEKVETGDFASEANYAKVRSKLLDRSNPNYSFRDTQTAFLNYADSIGKKMHNYKPTGTRPPVNTPSELGIKDYEYIKFGNSNLTGNVASKVLSDMSTGQVIDPQNDNVYDWKGDGYYLGDKFVAKDNDSLAKDVLQVRDQRFFGIPNPTGGGGVLGVTNNTSKKYGFGSGKQNVKSSNILSSLQSFPGVELKTVGDLQGLLGKVESSPEFKQELIDHLNKEMGSNISTKFLDDMIKDLIGNTKKKPE